MLMCRVANSQVHFTQAALFHPTTHTEEFEQGFQAVEVPAYFPDSTLNQIVVENGYASAIIQNKEAYYKPTGAVIDTVNVVFSLYPKNPEYWLTNYHVLLARRLRDLFQLDPSLNSNEIYWKITMQTDAENELEAMGLFHGFVLSYHIDSTLFEVEKQEQLKDTLPLAALPPLPSTPIVHELDSFIRMNGGYRDTAIVKILQRNQKNWPNSLVVVDWTGSMYHHGAMAVLWHLLQMENTNISYFTFFNDGNRKKDKAKKIGKTGGVVGVDAQDSVQILKTFYKVQKRGDGGDQPENNVEAVIRSIKKYPDFDHIILVADNIACIRDFVLWEKIGVPIHIVLPGNFNMLNHQYINLAYKTHGSIHTFDEDILDFTQDEAPKTFTYKEFVYFLNTYGLYQSESPVAYRLCNQFYGIKRYGKKSRDLLRKSRKQ